MTIGYSVKEIYESGEEALRTFYTQESADNWVKEGKKTFENEKLIAYFGSVYQIGAKFEDYKLLQEYKYYGNEKHMNISRFIDILKEVKEKYGDIPIELCASNFGSDKLIIKDDYGVYNSYGQLVFQMSYEVE